MNIESIRLRKLRSKKSSHKASDVFGCFHSELVVPIVGRPDVEAKQKTEYLIDKAVIKEKRKLIQLENIAKKNNLNDRYVQSYQALLKVQNPTPKQLKKLRKHARRLGLWIKQKDRSNSKRQRTPTKYDVYMNSPQWRNRKNLLFQKYGRTCFCGSTKRISVHHLRYENSEFGVEKDEDLAIVCWKCHEEFHKLYGVKQDSHSDFTRFKDQKLSLKVISPIYSMTFVS